MRFFEYESRKILERENINLSIPTRHQQRLHRLRELDELGHDGGGQSVLLLGHRFDLGHEHLQLVRHRRDSATTSIW